MGNYLEDAEKRLDEAAENYKETLKKKKKTNNSGNPPRIAV
jgi:hypothetical protein